jgi:predicted nucleotidyltransferase
MKLSPSKQQAIIRDFKKAVAGLYGERLDRVILYGSYARGDFHEESDIDFLVVLKDDQISVFREIDKINDAVFDLTLKFNTMISFVPTTVQKLEGSKMPLYHFIRKEGQEV